MLPFRPLLLCLCSLLATPAHAQAPTSGTNSASGSQPFTIDADDSLEYRQQERVYVAKGHAKVTRNGASVTADTLTAYERDKAGTAKADKTSGSLSGNGNSEIWKFIGDGHVVITNGATNAAGAANKQAKAPATAYGDHVTYDIDSAVAILTGHDLHLDQVNDSGGIDRVMARDSFEYNSTDHIAVARGDAKAVRQPQRNPATGELTGLRTVTADTLRVIFVTDNAGKPEGETDGKAGDAASGNLVADHMEAEGHVRITQDPPPASDAKTAEPSTVALSDRAVFDNKGNHATLLGHVRIARGPSQLEGDRAELDFTSGVSRLLTDQAPEAKEGDKKAPKSRIHGLLVPGQGIKQGMKTTKATQP